MGSVQGIGGAQDAARMQKVVSFYEKLPRGAAPAEKPSGLLQRYAARYMGKNPSAMRMRLPFCIVDKAKHCANDWAALVHVIGGLMLIGYAQNYYFHLRKPHRW